LWKVTYRCAAHCRFCTRHRQIGSAKGDLSENDILEALDYIAANPEIDEIILSGGDPLYVPATTTRIIKSLETISSVRVIRIGTRLPVQAPQSLAAAPLARSREPSGAFATAARCCCRSQCSSRMSMIISKRSRRFSERYFTSALSHITFSTATTCAGSSASSVIRRSSAPRRGVHDALQDRL
jgi:hypothetical protein